MSDDLKEIKERIVRDEAIEAILEELGCTHITREQRGTLVTAQLPSHHNSSNKRGVQVRYDESIHANVRNRGICGDIYTLVGYLQFECVTFEEVSEHLFKIKKFICDLLGYQDIVGGERVHRPKKQDPNSWLKKIKKMRGHALPDMSNPPLPEEVLNEYLPYPSMIWKDEGLALYVQEQFGIGFDQRSERITIPIRDKQGRLIGVKGRYVGDNKRIIEEKKYMYIIPCNKSIELYNLHMALPHILEKKEVILFEAEKSVMFAWQYGFKNTVGIGGDSITPAQIQLLKDLGIDVEWVFAFDKDKTSTWIKQQIGDIKNRAISVVYDTKNLLPKKSSPVDLGRETWKELYENNKYEFEI